MAGLLDKFQSVKFNRVIARVAFNLAKDSFIKNITDDLIDYLEEVSEEGIWDATTRNVQLLQVDKFEAQAWEKKIRSGASLAIRRKVEDVGWQKLNQVKTEDLIGIMVEKCYERENYGNDKPVNIAGYIMSSPSVKKWFLGQVNSLRDYVLMIYKDQVEKETGIILTDIWTSV